jgi:hypothetical protein
MIEHNFQRAVLEVLAISPRFDSHPVFNAVASTCQVSFANAHQMANKIINATATKRTCASFRGKEFQRS